MSPSFPKSGKTIVSLSVAAVVLYSLAILAFSCSETPIVCGEIDSYMLPILSIQYRGSLSMNEGDLERARQEFPELYGDVYGYEDLHATKLVVGKDGNWYSLYFPVLSMACIPVKIILQLLGFSLSYCLMLTSALWYVAALLIILLVLKRPPLQKLITLLLLMCGPFFGYLHWQSGETFMLSCVIISLVFWVNDRHRPAGFFVSLAGMINPTIMVLGAGIILHYLISACGRNRNLSRLIRSEWKNALKLVLCFLPSLIPFIVNAICTGRLNSTFGDGMLDDYGKRYIAYFFDLNFGYFTFFPVAFVMFLFFTLSRLLKRDWKSLCYAFAFLGTTAAFSLKDHINCGMVCLSRYGFWTVPIMLMYLSTEVPLFISGKRSRRLYYVLISLSLFVSSVVTAICILSDQGTNYRYFSRVAEMVLEREPGLYNPYYATFIARTQHIDGGYSYEGPVVYFDGAEARKILVTPGTAHQLTHMLTGDEESMAYLASKVDEAARRSDCYCYININPGSGVLLYAAK